MNTVWVLVCDSAKSRLFEVPDGAPWVLFETTTHEESRSKSSDLASDQPGSRSSEGGSSHHNALTPSSVPKENEKSHFAHLLGTTLDKAMRAGRFGKWVLVAPPHFVGLIKKELTPELKKHLMTTVDKDLTNLSTQELTERLKEATRIPLNEREVMRATENYEKRTH